METALISALVAALVTLTIEWLAKPGLEARKERILARVRSRSEAVRICHEIQLRLSMLWTRTPFGQPGRETITAEVARARTELVKLSHELQAVHVALSAGVRSLTPDEHEMMPKLAGRIRGYAMSDRTNAEVADALSDPVAALASLMFTSPYPLTPRRWRAVRHGRRQLALLKGDSPHLMQEE